MKALGIVALFMVFSACTMMDRGSEPSQPQGTEEIDYSGIRNFLGLNRAPSQLGYKERDFNTCDVGHGYPEKRQCRERTMSVLNFRLLCRDSMGTVSRVANMDPFANQRLRWEVGQLKGYVTTDSRGYGQISLITSRSKERARLILHSGQQYFGVRMGDLKMHVLPANWCR